MLCKNTKNPTRCVAIQKYGAPKLGNRRFIDDQGRLPNFFKEWREAAGFTQAQVEKALGWQASRVSHLENGRALVTEHVLTVLARLYRCKPADLVSGPPMRDDKAALFAELIAKIDKINVEMLDLAEKVRNTRELIERFEDYKS